MAEKKKYLLRLDARLYDTLERWAADDLRSVNAQMEYLLTEAVKRAGRMAGDTPPSASPPAGPERP